MKRDLMKTASFAALHFSVGFGVAYLISGSLPVALGVAMIEPAVNTVVFFFHELAWKRKDDGDGGDGGAELTAESESPRVEDNHSFRNLRSLAFAG